MNNSPAAEPSGLCYTEVNDVRNGQFYQTGGYWLISDQHANGMFPINRIADTAFDPCEELIWTVTTTVSPFICHVPLLMNFVIIFFYFKGQLTGYYGSTLEQYITLPIMPFDSKVSNCTVEECHLKSVFPTSRYSERIVYMLAENAIYAYSKFGMKIGFSTYVFSL